MTRLPGHLTSEGQSWFAELARAQREVQDAERRRDELVPQALAHGVGVRGVAKALRIDKATVSRRYGHSARDTPT
jgi:hypothetical protein